MIVLDTSVLIDGLTGPRDSAGAIRQAINAGERLVLPAMVFYEWFRGPRLPAEIAAQEALFPSSGALPFGPEEALQAATIYKSVRRPRGREIDIAIAASALLRNATLWTLNPRDFSDIPGLRLKT